MRESWLGKKSQSRRGGRGSWRKEKQTGYFVESRPKGKHWGLSDRSQNHQVLWAHEAIAGWAQQPEEGAGREWELWVSLEYVQVLWGFLSLGGRTQERGKASQCSLPGPSFPLHLLPCLWETSSQQVFSLNIHCTSLFHTLRRGGGLD